MEQNIYINRFQMMENDTKLIFFSYRNDLCLFLWSCTFRPRRSIFVPWWNLVERIVNHVLARIIEPVFPISIDFPGMSFFWLFTITYQLFTIGPFTNYVVQILAFLDHLPHSVDIFYLMNVDKKSDIFELPTPLLL